MSRIWTVLVTIVVLTGTALGQTPRERKNIDNMTPQELAAYKHAIGLLKQSTDPDNNYVHHANLHNLYTSSPPHGCEHGSDLFLPWHRWHLANFEKALQQTDPDHLTLSTKNVTIPYWNWNQVPTGKRYPKAFENALDGIVSNPLYDDFRNTDPSGPTYDEADMTGIVQDGDWNHFAGGPKDVNEYYGTLENPLHNTMHGIFIGGDMSDPGTAAMDPIYWSYHAFIDLQWDRWQKIFGTPPTSLTKVLRGFDGAPTVDGTVNVTDLGYFYTHTPESIAAPTPAPLVTLEPRATRLTTDISGAERSVVVWGGDGPFSFKGIKPAMFHRADLWFDEVRIPDTLSYRIEVFLHPVGEEYKAADAAGSLTIWKGHKTLDGKRHHMTANVFLPVTDKLKKIAAANPGKELAATAVVTPIAPSVRRKGRNPAVRPTKDEVQFKGMQIIYDGGGPFMSRDTGGDDGH